MYTTAAKVTQLDRQREVEGLTINTVFESMFPIQHTSKYWGDLFLIVHEIFRPPPRRTDSSGGGREPLNTREGKAN